MYIVKSRGQNAFYVQKMMYKDIKREIKHNFIKGLNPGPNIIALIHYNLYLFLINTFYYL